MISGKEQEIYRSGVGSLLCLVKLSRPDIANIVRELAKCMSRASIAALNELFRVIKFVLSTANYGLRIEPKMQEDEMWDLVVYSDSD